jgi:hypothetical protein
METGPKKAIRTLRRITANPLRWPHSFIRASPLSEARFAISVSLVLSASLNCTALMYFGCAALVNFIAHLFEHHYSGLVPLRGCRRCSPWLFQWSPRVVSWHKSLLYHFLPPEAVPRVVSIPNIHLRNLERCEHLCDYLNPSIDRRYRRHEIRENQEIKCEELECATCGDFDNVPE